MELSHYKLSIYLGFLYGPFFMFMLDFIIPFHHSVELHSINTYNHYSISFLVASYLYSINISQYQWQFIQNEQQSLSRWNIGSKSFFFLSITYPWYVVFITECLLLFTGSYTKNIKMEIIYISPIGMLLTSFLEEIGFLKQMRIFIVQEHHNRRQSFRIL